MKDSPWGIEASEIKLDQDHLLMPITCKSGNGTVQNTRMGNDVVVQYGWCHLFVLVLIGSGLLAPISSNTLFEDSLKCEEISRLHWLCISSTESPMVFTNRGVLLTNDHSFNSLIALHSYSRKPEEFSVSVNIDSGGAGSGIFFNVNRDNLGNYNGYAGVLSNQRAELIKFNRGTISVLASHASAFIKETRNKLTISKSVESIKIFCNGYYLYSIKESELPPGDCAIMVQPMSSALFNQFEVTSLVNDSLTFPAFVDNFNNISSFGWKKNGNGLIGIKDSALNIVTGNYQNCRYGVEFPLRDFSLSSIIKLDNGNDSSLYGVYLYPTQPEKSEKPGVIKFGLNKRGEFRVLNVRDSLMHSLKYPASSVRNNTIRYDTLNIIHRNNRISCYLNDHSIFESEGIGVIRGVGVFNSYGLNVCFDAFELICNEVSQETTVEKRFEARHTIRTYTYKTNTLQKDLLGRVYSAVSYDRIMNKRSAASIRISKQRAGIVVK